MLNEATQKEKREKKVRTEWMNEWMSTRIHKNVRKWLKLQEAIRPIRGSPYVNTSAYSHLSSSSIHLSNLPLNLQCLSTNNMITESFPLIHYPIWKPPSSYFSPQPEFLQFEPITSVCSKRNAYTSSKKKTPIKIKEKTKTKQLNNHN